MRLTVFLSFAVKSVFTQEGWRESAQGVLQLEEIFLYISFVRMTMKKYRSEVKEMSFFERMTKKKKR